MARRSDVASMTDDEIIARRPTFMVFFSFTAMLDDFTDEELGKMFRAMCNYAQKQKLPDFQNRFLNTVFKNFKDVEDRNRNSYIKTARERSRAGKGKKGDTPQDPDSEDPDGNNDENGNQNGATTPKPDIIDIDTFIKQEDLPFK